MSDSKVFAIIPARGGSKGIQRKNLQTIGCKPLVGLAVEQAIACPLIDRIIVNSEDQEIRAVAESFGAETMDRPEEFHHDNTIQEVDRLLMHCIREIEAGGNRVDVVVLLYATAPLRRVDTITEAVRKVVEDDYDSVLSLYEDSTYLWRVVGNSAIPINYDPKTRGPRQKEDWNQYAENKAVYVMRRDLLMETGCRLGGKIGYVIMSKLESIDVDNPQDLELVRILYRRS